jgi:hypothetical protein
MNLINPNDSNLKAGQSAWFPTLEGSQLAPLQGSGSISFDFPVVSLSSFAQPPANELSSLRDINPIPTQTHARI